MRERQAIDVAVERRAGECRHAFRRVGRVGNMKHAFLCCQPQTARGIRQQSTRAAWADRKFGVHAREQIVASQPGIAANPQRAITRLRQCGDTLAAQQRPAGSIEQSVHVGERRIESQQSGIVGTEHDTVVVEHRDRAHADIAQRTVERNLMAQVAKRVCARIMPLQATAVDAEPDQSSPTLYQRADFVASERMRAAGIVP